MSYEPPVTICDFVSEMSEKLTAEKDKYIYQQIRTYVDVDKEELIKVLQYDRNQYNKGYEDGLKEVVPVVHGYWIERSTIIESVLRCSNCKSEFNKITNYHIYDYCPHCGAKMDEKEGKQDA